MARIPFNVDQDYGKKNRQAVFARKKVTHPDRREPQTGSVRPTLFILGVLTLVFEILHYWRYV
jgi:hypothetical protein